MASTTPAPPTPAEMSNEMLQRHMQATYLSGHHNDTNLFGGTRAADPQRPSFPLRLPGQSLVLLNKASRRLQVQSAVPAVRILGLFDDNPQLHHHLDQLGQDDDIYQAPIFGYTLVPTSKDRTPEEELAAVDRMLEAHAARLTEQKDTFETNVKERRMGTVPEDTPLLGGPADPADPADPARCCQRLGLDKEVRSQKFAVISILRHPTEPAVCVFAAFEDEKRARCYLEDTLAPQVSDHHLDIVPMYEWIHLDAAIMDDDMVPRQYRNRQLNEIMQAKRSQQSQVDQYLHHCEETGELAKVREIDLSAEPAAEPAAGGADGAD